MIHRTPPDAPRYLRDPLWERTEEFKRLVKALQQDPGADLPAALTAAQRVAVEAEVAMMRSPGLTKGEYRAALERAMRETRLQIAAPRSDTPTSDLIDAWRQPEAKRL